MWAPLPYKPTPMPPAEISALRILREGHSRDSMNSRMWDNFHATPPLFVGSDVLKHTSVDNPRFNDMNPISSRTNVVDYRRQISYMPDKPIKVDASGLTEPSKISYELPPSLPSANPYLSRLDPAGDDSRNIIRELKSAVIEDNRDRMLDSSRLIIKRQFSSSRYLPKKSIESASEMMAYELLRPKFSLN
jgi:hypothetical protein